MESSSPPWMSDALDWFKYISGIDEMKIYIETLQGKVETLERKNEMLRIDAETIKKDLETKYREIGENMATMSNDIHNTRQMMVLKKKRFWNH